MRLAAALISTILTTPAWAQGPEMEVVCFDVGTGDATLIISPTGGTMLIDGGGPGIGTNEIVPELQRRGITHLDYICASHYHGDHIGGLDELVQAGITVGTALDRGDIDAPTSSHFQEYEAAFRSVRRDVVPSEWLDFGDGVRLQCLSSNGRFANGATLDLSGTAQQENSASVSWRLEYGDFSMFVGGDLTGGSPNSVDVEKPVSIFCGDVDVYRVNMHGSSISSSRRLLNRLKPEFAIISVSSPNSSNFPRADVIQRLNEDKAAIPVWCTSSGNGGYGFSDARGDICVFTDGRSYRAESEGGLGFTAWCDEVKTAPLPVNAVVITEFHRDPASVGDFEGEWLELTGTLPEAPVGLAGARLVVGNGEEFTFATNFKLSAGESMVVASMGIPLLNGDHRPSMVWPEGALSLKDRSGTIALIGPDDQEIDRVDYDLSWPGGKGISAERIDALQPNDVANWTNSTTQFGSGDRGTPGLRNSQEITEWFPGGPIWIGYETAPQLGNRLDMVVEAPGEAGQRYQALLTLTTSPGTLYQGVWLPFTVDALYDATTVLPGWTGTVPTNERIEFGTFVPNQGRFAGYTVYAVVLTTTATGDLRNWSRAIGMPVLGVDD